MYSTGLPTQRRNSAGLNSAANPAAWRVSSQCNARTNGAIKIPPPMSVTPATNPDQGTGEHRLNINGG